MLAFQGQFPISVERFLEFVGDPCVPNSHAAQHHDISSKIMIYHVVGGIPTPLKNISQWEGLSHVLWKIKSV